MHTTIKSLLALLLVSSTGACAAVEEDTSVADSTEVTEEAQEELAASAVESAEPDEAQLVGGEGDARNPDQSAIFYYCFQGWTAYNDCHNYGASGKAAGYWSGYSCTYGNIFGGTCYQGYALHVW